ncbi:MAG TPA: hypothetical protein DDX06_11185 [Curvibacter sp.]|nr:hypothetical protein [Curvibacter sp.]|tara:strand:- start:996 stop:1439 length:444 start_codon:yes stop_codon:yes gene_type:complete
MPDYDDPAVEERWCAERRAEVAAYLAREKVVHGEIGEWPAWHIAPIASIWAIESKKSPGWVGWWVISGDLPCDYVSASDIKHPRDALRAIAESWLAQSEVMARGETSPELSIGPREEWPSLAPLLKSRASTLLDIADDHEVWAEDDL